MTQVERDRKLDDMHAVILALGHQAAGDGRTGPECLRVVMERVDPQHAPAMPDPYASRVLLDTFSGD